MNARRIVHAWIGATLAILLFLLSLTGDGTGILRGGRIVHPAWSYALVLGVVVLLVVLAGRDRRQEAVR